MSSRPQFWQCLWPGLARLWVLGDVSSLIVALGFGVLLQVALAVTFLWPELWGAGISPLWSSGVTWVFVLWFWVAGFRAARTFCQGESEEPGVADASVDQLFRQSQTSYLKGHWIEAETSLQELLALRPTDLEGRLLLAGVFRRTKRLDLAQQELEALQEHPQAGRWRFEIGRELELLQELRDEMGETAADSSAVAGTIAPSSGNGSGRGAKVA